VTAAVRPQRPAPSPRAASSPLRQNPAAVSGREQHKPPPAARQPRRTVFAFWAVTGAFMVAMASTTVPTPLYALYQRALLQRWDRPAATFLGPELDHLCAALAQWQLVAFTAGPAAGPDDGRPLRLVLRGPGGETPCADSLGTNLCLR